MRPAAEEPGSHPRSSASSWSTSVRLSERRAVEITEDDEAISATLDGAELGLVIRRGHTIDAIQYLPARDPLARVEGERKEVVVDAADTATGAASRSRTWPTGPPRTPSRAAGPSGSSR